MEHALTALSNAFIVLCLTGVLVFTVEIYCMVRASSIWWLMIGWGYILIWRSLVLIESLGSGPNGLLQSHSAWVLLVFYPLMLVGMWKLMNAIRTPTTLGDKDE